MFTSKLGFQNFSGWFRGRGSWFFYNPIQICQFNWSVCSLCSICCTVRILPNFRYFEFKRFSLWVWQMFCGSSLHLIINFKSVSGSLRLNRILIEWGSSGILTWKSGNSSTKKRTNSRVIELLSNLFNGLVVKPSKASSLLLFRLFISPKNSRVFPLAFGHF